MTRERQRQRLIVSLVTLAAIGPSLAEGPPPEWHWSNAVVDTTPQQNVDFHGPFCNELIEVTRDGLPGHAFVRIEFDLLILRTWGGSVQYVNDKPDAGGPDYFRCSVGGGPILLSTTFSNLPDDARFMAKGKTQNFPSPVPGDLLPAKTGATATGTLGYDCLVADGPDLFPMDATYHMILLVPQRAADLAVRLEGLGLGSEGQRGILDESWGVHDFKVTPLKAEDVPTPDDAAIAAAFATALDSSSTGQPAAINTLVAGLDHTAAWIGQHVQPQPIDAAAVAAAVADLAADDQHAVERTTAGKTLFGFGPAVEPYLRDALAASHGEVRERVEWVLGRLGITAIADDNLRRVALATRVLEIIGTPAAVDARRKLVGM